MQGTPVLAWSYRWQSAYSAFVAFGWKQYVFVGSSSANSLITSPGAVAAISSVVRAIVSGSVPLVGARQPVGRLGRLGEPTGGQCPVGCLSCPRGHDSFPLGPNEG